MTASFFSTQRGCCAARGFQFATGHDDAATRLRQRTRHRDAEVSARAGDQCDTACKIEKLLDDRRDFFRHERPPWLELFANSVSRRTIEWPSSPSAFASLPQVCRAAV